MTTPAPHGAEAAEARKQAKRFCLYVALGVGLVLFVIG
jgi:hypothetical protein